MPSAPPGPWRVAFVQDGTGRLLEHESMTNRTPAGVAWMLLLTPLVLAAGQSAPQGSDEALEPLRMLVGRWTGDELAGFGRGTGTRSYRFILQGRYLLGENASRFPPQDGLPNGDRHDDWALFSHDEQRDTIVLRQFNSEGFVNVFVLQTPSDPRHLVFALESSENGPAGLSGSLTFELVSDDEFVEHFELATPDAPDMVRIQNRWRRAE